MIREAYPNELYHHGVLGMKWGVRRYQNYDGTYTKKGLERYRSSESKYDDAKAKYTAAKEEFKSARKEAAYKDDADSIEKMEAARSRRQNAKIQMKSAKSHMDRRYDQLKRDKLADKGKDLYAKGKRITSNNTFASGVRKAGVVTSVIGFEVARHHGRTKVTDALMLAGLGVSAASIPIRLSNIAKNRQLREYYGHSRKD